MLNLVLLVIVKIETIKMSIWGQVNKWLSIENVMSHSVLKNEVDSQFCYKKEQVKQGKQCKIQCV